MQLEARAKINWSLDITGVREDGYHLMDMLMQPVSLSDTITLLPAEDLSLRTEGFPRLNAPLWEREWEAEARMQRRFCTG